MSAMYVTLFIYLTPLLLHVTLFIYVILRAYAVPSPSRGPVRWTRSPNGQPNIHAIYVAPTATRFRPQAGIRWQR